MKKAVIVSAVRTPIGAYGGVFKSFSAVDLGVCATVEAMRRINLDPSTVDEVILGNVLQAGQGQNVARQVSIGAGIPESVSSFTINKVCGSGLKSVALAAQAIRAGEGDVYICGGTENMSAAPYLLPKLRWGARMGSSTVVDYMVEDGLTDIFNGYHMGITAENIAEKYSLSREEQDDLAATSQNRAEAAIKAGKFKDEIVAVEIPQRKGEPVVVDTDEYPKFGTSKETLSRLRPAFKKDGTVTAGNSSGINDGAAIFVVMSEDRAEKLGLEVIASIEDYASSGVDPKIMGTGPIPATKKVLEKTGLKVEDLDLIEANEAFAAQALSVSKELGFDMDKVNVNGGAIAIGHPIGASGARILVSLVYEMKKRACNTGLATLCIGGGQGIAMIVKR